MVLLFSLANRQGYINIVYAVTGTNSSTDSHIWSTVALATLFSHFVRGTPHTVFITHKPNLYHLKARCLKCVMTGSVFSYLPKFRRNRSLKTTQKTNSNFWSVTSQRVLGPGRRYPYHMNIFFRNDF